MRILSAAVACRCTHLPKIVTARSKRVAPHLNKCSTFRSSLISLFRLCYIFAIILLALFRSRATSRSPTPSVPISTVCQLGEGREAEEMEMESGKKWKRHRRERDVKNVRES
jgi:hypothetical protein